MAGEWVEKTTFAKLVDEGTLEIGDGYRAKNEELGGDGPIFLRAGHVTDSHIDFSGVERFRAELEPRLRSKLSRPGDAVVTTKGNSTGRTTFVSPTMPSFVYSPHLSYWRSKNRDRIAGAFLRYWSKGSEFSEQLAGMKASTDMAPYLSLVDQKRLTISLPPIGDQRAIGHILGALDDKIELNRRMSETLEAMAGALFKSWFVDFDPVRAKAEQRDPGVPKPLADLFPARLVDSELGEIPEGWEVRPLGDLLELAYGKALKAEDRRDGTIPVYGSNGQVGWHNKRLAAGPGVVVGRKGNPGVVTWAETDFFVIDTAFYVAPKSPALNLHFLFHALRSHDLASLSADSAVPGLNRNLAYMSKQSLPGQPVLEWFAKAARSLAERAHWLEEESRTLATLRDTLLPKLISGELRVSAAEQLIEEIV
jgi:type I restriction enzyme S subunit